MTGFLLDTNVVSELIKPKPRSAVMRWVAGADEMLLHFSVLTLGEIRKGIVSQADAARRASLESWLSGLTSRFSERILPLDLAVADRWGHVTGICKAKGMTVPAIDGMLAATALHYDLILVTRNVKDVQVTGVDTLNPWDL